MARDYDEAVLRITARYVAEARAGRQPRLSDYLAHYPQYAEAITDFVAYFHIVEADIPSEPNIVPPLSQQSQVALAQAWERIASSDKTVKNTFTSLLMLTSQQERSLAQLSSETGLSLDIIRKLEQRLIQVSTIPYAALKCLAQALQQPVAAILASLGPTEQQLGARSIAESPADYSQENQRGEQIESFREAVERSGELSGEQKETWFAILRGEGL
jgi:hypothetical protein